MVLRVLGVFLCLAALGTTAFGHNMSEADQIRAAEGGFLDFFPLGAMHMLTGYDHLLFLFGVVFFLTKFKDILKFVTAFTLGHSITLIAATFLSIQANYFLVDAVIALTVCYKGFDNLDGFKKYFHVKAPNLLFIVFTFGLIHGFGLSTRLQQLTIGEGMNLLTKIIFFNIGVEAGQVAALAIILVALSAWRRTASFERFSAASNTALIIAGSFLVLVQLHGYTHEMHSDAYGFNEDAHFHSHVEAATVAEPAALPKGWHLDPDDPVPHRDHDDSAASDGTGTPDLAHAYHDDAEAEDLSHAYHDAADELPEGWHLDPGETVPHRH
jgi:HupE/UreJ protein